MFFLKILFRETKESIILRVFENKPTMDKYNHSIKISDLMKIFIINKLNTGGVTWIDKNNRYTHIIYNLQTITR